MRQRSRAARPQAWQQILFLERIRVCGGVSLCCVAKPVRPMGGGAGRAVAWEGVAQGFAKCLEKKSPAGANKVDLGQRTVAAAARRSAGGTGTVGKRRMLLAAANEFRGQDRTPRQTCFVRFGTPGVRHGGREHALRHQPRAAAGPSILLRARPGRRPAAAWPWVYQYENDGRCSWVAVVVGVVASAAATPGCRLGLAPKRILP